MSKNKSKLLLIFFSIIVSIFISFSTVLIVNGTENFSLNKFFLILIFSSFTIYIIISIYTKVFLKSQIKDASQEVLSKSYMNPIVTTNMEELITETKDDDSERRFEYTEMKKRESFRREFIGNLAHEIKTPLFTTQSYILTLLDGAINDKSINKKYLKTASKAVERLNLIVKDLDLITKIESGESNLNKTKFDIIDLVNNIFEMLEFSAKKKNIRFNVEKESDLNTKVNADKEKIEQVLTNLIDNSVKYGKENGTTEVVVQNLN